MKEKLENNQESKKVRKEKNADFLGLWKNFLKSGNKQLSQEEEFDLETDDIKLKKELEKSLKRAQNIQESIFKESVRVKVVDDLEISSVDNSNKKRVIKKEDREQEDDLSR